MVSTVVKRTQLVPQQGGTGKAALTFTVNRPGPSLRDGVAGPASVVTAEGGWSGDGYTVSAELYRATIDNDLVEDISDLLTDGAIAMDLSRDIKLTASFTIHDPDRITPYVDFLAPFVRITYDDGTPEVYQQVGLYTTVTPPGTYGPTDAMGKYACDDLCRVLADWAYTDSSTSNAGTTYTGQIGGTIANAGIGRYSIPSLATTLPVAITWPVKTTRLQKANGLIDQLGWYHLGSELDGRLSTPGAPLDLATTEPWRTLGNADVMAMIDVTPAAQQIANVVVVVNNDAASSPLSSTARNDDPDSPTSTVGPANGGLGIGREIVRWETVSGKTTQAALDALAARYLAESRTQYRTCKLTLLHDPTALKPHQVVRLALTGVWSVFNGVWWIRQATMGFTPSASTVITVSQVTDDTTGASV